MMGGPTHEIVAYSAAARDQQDAFSAQACASPTSAIIDTGDVEVLEETVAGLCLRANANRVTIREVRVKRLHRRSSDYAALLDILRRCSSLEVLELPNFVISDADMLDTLPRLFSSNAHVSCEVACNLFTNGRKLKGLHLTVGEDDEPAVALSALRNLPGMSAVSFTTAAMGTGVWDPFLFILKNTGVRHLDIFHDVEQPWPARLKEAIAESLSLQSIRLELSSSAAESNDARAVDLLRQLSLNAHLKSISLAIKLPDLRPDVLSGLLREVARSPKVHEVDLHCTTADCALVVLGHVASRCFTGSWQVALGFGQGAAEAAIALVTVGAAAGVRGLAVVVRGPGGTVQDVVCEQLAGVLARERSLAAKVVCRVTEAGREVLLRAKTLVPDAPEDGPAPAAAALAAAVAVLAAA